MVTVFQISVGFKSSIVSDTDQSRSPRPKTGEYFFHIDLNYVGIFLVEPQK